MAPQIDPHGEQLLARSDSNHSTGSLEAPGAYYKGAGFGYDDGGHSAATTTAANRATTEGGTLLQQCIACALSGPGRLVVSLCVGLFIFALLAIPFGSSSELQLLAIAVPIAFVLAAANGGNDIANSVGTSVGCGALEIGPALRWGALVEVLGAATMGSSVASTLTDNIVDPLKFSGHPESLSLVMLASLLGSCLSTLLATIYGLPVSATHGVISGMVAVTATARGAGAVNAYTIGLTVGAWVLSPLMGLIVAMCLHLCVLSLVTRQADPGRAAQKWEPVGLALTLTTLVTFLLLAGPNPMRPEPAWLVAIVAPSVFFCVLAMRVAWKRMCAASESESEMLRRRRRRRRQHKGGGRGQSGRAMTYSILQNLVGDRESEEGGEEEEEEEEEEKKQMKMEKAAALLLVEGEGKGGEAESVCEPSGNGLTGVAAAAPQFAVAAADTADNAAAAAAAAHGVAEQAASPFDGGDGYQSAVDSIPEDAGAVAVAKEFSTVALASSTATTNATSTTSITMVPPSSSSESDSEVTVVDALLSSQQQPDSPLPSPPPPSRNGNTAHHHHATFAEDEVPFAPLLILSGMTLAFAHGGNDIANAVAPLAVIVTNAAAPGSLSLVYSVPWWALGVCCVGFGLGVVVLGSRTVATIGSKITTFSASKSFSAQLGATIAVLLSSAVGMPTSTSHCLIGAVVGCGFAEKILPAGTAHRIHVKELRKILLAWLWSIPMALVIALVVYWSLAWR